MVIRMGGLGWIDRQRDECLDEQIDKLTISGLEVSTHLSLFKISFFGHFAPFVPPSCAYHLPHLQV